MVLFVNTTLAPSRIHGTGLFSAEPIPRGKIVFLWPMTDRHQLRPEDVVREAEKGDRRIYDSSVRIIGRHFVYSECGLEPDEFVNHASSPNLVYVMGAGVALRDIAAFEELTIDYRLLNPRRDGAVLDADAGWPARESLLRSLRTLVQLIESLPDWEG